MKRFVFGAAVAVALGFVSAGRADAQILYNTTVTPDGGFSVNRGYVNPILGTGYVTNSSYSPFMGYNTRTMGATMYGGAYNRGYTYNPWTRQLLNYSMYSQPTPFNPFTRGYFGGTMFGRW